MSGQSGFADLLERLGYAPDDLVVVCHQPPAGQFASARTTAAEAPAVADRFADQNVWFAVNPVTPKASGRGLATDVARLAALFADLDIKVGGLPDKAAAIEVIKQLSVMLGTKPVAIVASGHGYQPYWAVDPEDPAAHLADDNRADAVALLRRFGRLVAHVAELHGGRVDPVYDLSRILRAPGTTNYKSTPVPVTVSGADGYPLTIKDADERLTEYGAVEQPSDRDVHSAVTAPVADWDWATITHAAVTRAIASWAQQTPSARHPWLLGHATSLAFARRLGWVTEPDHYRAVEVLRARFGWLLQNVSTPRLANPGEVAGAIAKGVAVAQSKTDADARADWDYWVKTNAVDAYMLELESVNTDGFWDSRAALAHIHAVARARRACPWAVLGVVLARVVTTVPSTLVLPPLVGGEASLNLFVGLVGASGGGKGAATAAGKAAVQLGHLNSFPVGSGEGLTHLFVHRVKGEVVQHTTAVLAVVPEVDTLAALTSRQGSTLQPVLRQAFMGEEFGFGYADPTKRLAVGEHTYRLCLIVGIQPKRAGALLEDVDGGTPQRYLWMPATDRDMPDAQPSCPPPLQWSLPRSLPDVGDVYTGRRWLPVCDTAREAIDAAWLERARGKPDALDGHVLLTRLKVAAALAILDGRIEVTVEDWSLAGTVIDVSGATRAQVVGELHQSRNEANRQRGEAEGTRAVVVQEKLEAAVTQRVGRIIVRALRKHGDWATENEVKKTVASRDRAAIEEALTALVDSGQVELRDGDKPLYRIAEGV